MLVSVSVSLLSMYVINKKYTLYKCVVLCKIVKINNLITHGASC